MIQDARTELFRHEGIAVTRSWVIVDGVRHAVRNIDQTSLSTVEPPRSTALGVLFVCLLLALLTLYRIIAGDFSVGLGWLILVACAVVIVIAGHVAFMQETQCLLTIRFENGESIPVSTKNASRASRLQDAVHDALDQLDYHDTDNARPTVVLASLEPTQLTAVGGPAAEVVRINDDTMAKLTDEAGDVAGEELGDETGDVSEVESEYENYHESDYEIDEIHTESASRKWDQAPWVQALASDCQRLIAKFKR